MYSYKIPNIPSIVVTDEVLKLHTLISLKTERNIYFIEVTDDVSNFDTSIDSKDAQQKNIYDISVTELVIKLDKLIDVKDIHK